MSDGKPDCVNDTCDKDCTTECLDAQSNVEAELESLISNEVNEEDREMVEYSGKMVDDFGTHFNGESSDTSDWKYAVIVMAVNTSTMGINVVSNVKEPTIRSLFQGYLENDS